MFSTVISHPYCYGERFWTYFSYIVIRLLMLHLICDRFLNIHLSMEYSVLFHKGIIRRLIGFLWLVAGILVIILDITFNCSAEAEIILVFLILDIMVAIAGSTTYTYFYFKIRTSLRFHRENTSAILHDKQKQQQKFLVPFVMIFTYIFFNCTSTLLFASLKFSKGLTKDTLKILHTTAVLFWIIGCITDVIVYTFLQKDVYLILSGVAKKAISST